MNFTKELLDFDPMRVAEDITGDRRSDDTTILGMCIAMEHSEIKNTHLQALGDTLLRNELDRYQQIIQVLGFEEVLCLPFTGASYHGEPPYEEKFFIYAHRELGILLAFDTYNTTMVNGGRFYYCWKPGAGGDCTSSGSLRLLPGREKRDDYHPDDYYWVGYHDCREAIRYHIGELLRNGTFYPKWPTGHNQFLWLLHYMDSKVEGYDYKAISLERLKMLPTWVQEMVNVDLQPK